MTDWENRTVADAERMGMVVEGEAALGRRYRNIPQVKWWKAVNTYDLTIGRREVYVAQYYWDFAPCNDHGLVKHEYWTSAQLSEVRVRMMCAGLIDRYDWHKGGYHHGLSLDGVLLMQQVHQELAAGVRAIA